MTSQTVDDGENPPVVTTNTYDVRNKLVEVAVQGGNTVQYVYDGDGNRVRETVTDTGGSVTTLYLTDTGNPTGYAQPLEAWTSGTPNSLAATYLIGDRVYGQADDGGVVSYLQADGHGSTRLMTGDDGDVTAVYNYDAFGGAVGFTPSSAATPFLFGGDAWYDAPTGLYIHGNGVRARLGFFFIQRDPYGRDTQAPQSLHKYLYADANPVMGVDPSGYRTYKETMTVVVAQDGMLTAAYGLSTKALLGWVSGVCATASLMSQLLTNIVSSCGMETTARYSQAFSNATGMVAIVSGLGAMAANGFRLLGSALGKQAPGVLPPAAPQAAAGSGGPGLLTRVKNVLKDIHDDQRGALGGGGRQGFKGSAARKSLEGYKNHLKSQLTGRQREAFKQMIEKSKVGEQYSDKETLEAIFQEVKDTVKP